MLGMLWLSSSHVWSAMESLSLHVVVCLDVVGVLLLGFCQFGVAQRKVIMDIILCVCWECLEVNSLGTEILCGPNG